MNAGIAAPLHFATHLFGVLVALGAAVTLIREPGRRLARAAGVLGFLSLAAAGIAHGADFVGEAERVTLALRAGGYLLLLVWATSLWGRGPAARVGIAAAAVLFAAAELMLARDALLVASHIVRLLAYALVSLVALSAVRRSIRFRFLAGFVGVLLVVVFAITMTVTQVIDRNLRAGALDRARELAIATSDGFDPELVHAAQLMSFFVEAELSGQQGVGEIIDSSGLNLRDLQLDFIMFLSREGAPIASKGIGTQEATTVAGSQVALDCLTGIHAGVGNLAQLDARRLGVLGCVPFRDQDQQFAGVAIAGVAVDDALLDRVAAPGVRAAVFTVDDPVPVAITGSFPGIAPGDEMLTRAEIQTLRESLLLPGATEQRELPIGRDAYFSAFAPLVEGNGRVIGILMISEPASTVANTQRDVIRLIFLVTMGVVTLALLLALLAARRITRPVLALTEAARRVQAGDLSAKAEVTARDEVGDLATAFNSMTESVTDMTGRLRAAAEEEARLRDRLETVLRSMGDGLIAVDRAGEIATYNPAAAALLGRPESQVLGHPVATVLKWHDGDGQPLALDDDLAGMAFVERADGRDVPVAITSSPLRDGSDAPLGRVFVIRDMSREHEVERMKTEFLSNVSHELRTPLTPIIGYSEIMTRRAVPEERGQEFAQAILDSARRLERIVAMLVDFSAMEGGRMTIEAEPVALRKIVQSAAEDWKRRTPRHTIVTKVAPRLPNAMADTSLLRRALDELLDNAVKYSPDGGKIRVSVSSENGAERRILKVDVEDEGIGIEEGDLPDIFEDFRQVDASDTRTFGGLGLGLAFVRRIVEAHGGRIEVRSTPGEGSTFSFSLPASDT